MAGWLRCDHSSIDRQWYAIVSVTAILTLLPCESFKCRARCNNIAISHCQGRLKAGRSPEARRLFQPGLSTRSEDQRPWGGMTWRRLLQNERYDRRHPGRDSLSFGLSYDCRYVEILLIERLVRSIDCADRFGAFLAGIKLDPDWRPTIFDQGPFSRSHNWILSPK